MKIAVSALTIQDAGPLEILRECIQSAARLRDLQFTFFVNDAPELPPHPNIEYYKVGFPKRAYIKRLYWEYLKLRRISKELRPDVWLSLGDITPNVCARIRATYVHNSLFFWRPTGSDLLWDPAQVLKAALLPGFIRLRAKKNNFVCCQTQWMARTLSRFLGLPQTSFLVIPPRGASTLTPSEGPAEKGERGFFYPAFPRVFKNFEAAINLAADLNIPLLLTIDGRETRYSRHIKHIADGIPSIRLIGWKQHAETMKILRDVDLLLFTSRLETFGLPLLEAAKLGKKILTPYSPWAIEVLKDYPHVYYFQSHQEGLDQARRALQDLPPTNDQQRIGFTPFCEEVGGFEELFHRLTNSASI